MLGGLNLWENRPDSSRLVMHYNFLSDTISASHLLSITTNFFFSKSVILIVQVDKIPEMTWARYRCAMVP